jgi:N-carbamoylputrescine amidase
MKWSRRRMLKAFAASCLATSFQPAGIAAGRGPKTSSSARTKVRVALMQVETAPDVQDNYRRAFQMARDAGLEKPDLIVFPELFAMGYRPEGMRPYAQTVKGEAVREFAAIARETDAHIVFGLPLQIGEDIYDSVLLFSPSGLAGVYHKTHLVYHPHHLDNEQQYFMPGQRLGNFETSLGPLGLFICHDGLFPEVPRCLVLNGAELLVWCVNAGPPGDEARQHAFYNLVPVVAVNPVIKADKTGKITGGGSVLVAADQTVVCESHEPREEFLIGEVDLSLGRKLRLEGEQIQDLFRVRRPDLYGPIVRSKAKRGMVA